MDKKKSVLNVSFAIISKIVLLLAAIVVRRLLIQNIGNDVNGLNTLYTNIIGILSIAELGVGVAISFSMYKPIVEGDVRKTAALYRLYKRLYLIIGFVIFLGGVLVMPFLPHLIGDYATLHVNVYFTFFLTLLSVALSYLYTAKVALIEAHKNNYIITVLFSVSRLIRYGLQIASILIWSSYTAYLICQIIEVCVMWGLTEIVARKMHRNIIGRKEKLDDKTKREIIKNVKAMIMHEIGTVMVTTVDSVIISAYIGVVILGKYTNYTYIAGSLTGIIALVFSSLTSVVGHLHAMGNRKKTKQWFDRFYYLNFMLGLVSFFGYYAVIDSLVIFLFGPGLEISRTIVLIITVNHFTVFMRRTPVLFHNAAGIFHSDRWKPIVEGFVNLVLSLLFVNVFPDDLKVAGVIAATIVTTLLISYTVEPYVVYHNVFEMSPKMFYVRNYSYTVAFIGGLVLLSFLMRDFNNIMTNFFVNGIISVGISLVIIMLLWAVDKSFRTAAFSWICEKTNDLYP